MLLANAKLPKALLLVPVPIVIPRPAQPLVLVVTTAVMLLRSTFEFTKPVSKDIPTGGMPAAVLTLTVFWVIEDAVAELLRELPT